MKKTSFIEGAALRCKTGDRAVRHKLLLLLLVACCCAMLGGCASLRKTSSVNSIRFEAPPIEVLPIAVDVAVTGQKGTGEANGKTTEIESLKRQAVAKALNQDPPSPDGADLLVGMDVFEERRGSEVKVTVTGYHAYYTNFRTAPPDTLSNDQRDSLRREEYAEIFEIARTLKDLAEEDSAQVEVVKSGKRSATVKISYKAKHLPPKIENVKSCDGTSQVIQPVYHTVLADGVFDINMSSKKSKRKDGKVKITDMGASNKGNESKNDSAGESKGGGGLVWGIIGGIAAVLLIIIAAN